MFPKSTERKQKIMIDFVDNLNVVGPFDLQLSDVSPRQQLPVHVSRMEDK